MVALCALVGVGASDGLTPSSLQSALCCSQAAMGAQHAKLNAAATKRESGLLFTVSPTVPDSWMVCSWR